jgi:hypothetical protein
MFAPHVHKNCLLVPVDADTGEPQQGYATATSAYCSGSGDESEERTVKFAAPTRDDDALVESRDTLDLVRVAEERQARIDTAREKKKKDRKLRLECEKRGETVAKMPALFRFFVTWRLIEHKGKHTKRVDYTLLDSAELFEHFNSLSGLVTVEDSVLRTEMENLESEEEDVSEARRVLWYKPMSWMGQIRTHHRDESWSDDL